MEKRIITTDITEEDRRIEGSLRPQLLEDYIGQEKTKENLKVYIEAAKQRGDVLDHVLFYGPPGLGKTTLSGIIANEMGVHMKVTSGPAIEKPGEMAAILNNLQEGDVLFVDEIHRLNRQVEEVLYPAMEDFAIDIMLGKESSARSIRLELPHFTLVGATTRAGQLSGPLRDRFGVSLRLELYTTEELARIITIGEKPEPENTRGPIAVVTAGTSDIPVAEEAAQTAEYFGSHVERIYDVGVSGLHRLMSRLEQIQSANCVVAVAGMEGALGTVIAGLVENPVIAVPTSVGYGANFNGLSALLTMINSCANGIAVLNIDNGYGAGYMATQINRLAERNGKEKE